MFTFLMRQPLQLEKKMSALSYTGLNKHVVHADHCCKQDVLNVPSVQAASVVPWAAYPSGGRRRLREGSVASEAFSAHTGPSGWSWRELELTRCRL